MEFIETSTESSYFKFLTNWIWRSKVECHQMGSWEYKFSDPCFQFSRSFLGYFYQQFLKTICYDEGTFIHGTNFHGLREKLIDSWIHGFIDITNVFEISFSLGTIFCGLLNPWKPWKLIPQKTLILFQDMQMCNFKCW